MATTTTLLTNALRTAITGRASLLTASLLGLAPGITATTEAATMAAPDMATAEMATMAAPGMATSQDTAITAGTMIIAATMATAGTTEEMTTAMREEAIAVVIEGEATIATITEV